MLTDLMCRLRALVRRPSVERELDEEIRLHLEHQIQRYRQTGMPQREAARRAHLALGGLEQIKEQCRDARGIRLIDTTRQDLRYAFRAMRRNPGFATMAIVSLALGIGANTAIFTLINAVMLRALPVHASEELVSVGDASRPTALWEGGPMVDPVFSYPMYERLRDQNRVFTGLLASGKSGSIEMSAGDGALEEVRGRLVSGNYFDVLGVSAVIGRTFSAKETQIPGTSPVVVISHDFWERRFGRDTGVVGRTIRLNGSPFTVIGVGPRYFTGDVVGSATDIWIPLAMQPQVNPGHERLERRDSNWLLGMGRLKRGVSIEMARAEMTRLAQEALIDFEGTVLSPEQLRDIRRQRIQVQPGAKGFSWIRKNTSSLLFTLMGVVGLVLIIACANVANLLLARAMTRQREIAVRLAVGASRSRVIRQLLTEGAILAALGGAASLVLAGWGSSFLSRLASQSGPNAIPFDVDVRPDVTVLVFTAGVSLLTAIVFGLAPAIRSTRVELSPALKESTRSLDRGRWPLGKLLVISQLAVSVPLLIGAGLFIRSLANLQALDVGYSRDKLLLVDVDLAGSGYETKAQQLAVARSLLEHLASVPGVRGVTVSANGLFSGGDSHTEGLQIEGFHPQQPADSSSSFDQVGPNYFRVIGVPILAGRDFNERDTASAPAVAIINETMARFYFGTRDPVGKILRNGGDAYTIVGVAKDSKQRALGGRTERRFYISALQDGLAMSRFAIRTAGDAAAMIPTIRRELQIIDPALNVSSIESVRILIDQSIRGERSMAQLSGFFGVLALVLSAAGLYGVMSYAMSRRTNEIGLRMALGADRGDVILMVLRETLVLMVAGLALGLPAALGAMRLIDATLVGVSASDPVIAGGAILALLAVGLCAGGIPAARASHVDPVAALRRD